MSTRMERTKIYRYDCNDKWSNYYFRFINDNIDKEWEWFELYRNTFTENKDAFNDKEYRRYMAAYKIQQWWYKITMSPDYKIGRKFINLKYNQLFE
jgi:hypothetical protein